MVSNNPPGTTPNRRSDRPRVLVVDDHAPGRRALARFLDLSGFDVTVAADGTSALEILRNGPLPDFVLTDLRLPDLDGIEVAHHARQLTPPPIVDLITGYEPEGTPEDHRRWGIDRIFTKPLNVHDLVASLRSRHARAELLSGGAGGSPIPWQGPAQDLSPEPRSDTI